MFTKQRNIRSSLGRTKQWNKIEINVVPAMIWSSLVEVVTESTVCSIASVDFTTRYGHTLFGSFQYIGIRIFIYHFSLTLSFSLIFSLLGCMEVGRCRIQIQRHWKSSSAVLFRIILFYVTLPSSHCFNCCLARLTGVYRLTNFTFIVVSVT